ncbi:hypothetical protein ZYGR_0AK05900 [Zygosaccharomyces rouxii]|uniref:DNA repair and recombination protein RAD52 n=1 Tax=Zygosaccharomyces rouxii TaxID=4956 RepID=A0A1Q3AEG9_ZYGRO|nr:hypothetical protein ZYGR_0AK05900 [Zygosaccharomyces rouxii]
MESKNGLHFKSNEDIQAKLDKKLGPEYISKRVGFGSSRVAYIEGWKVINLANQIFGFNGWSTEVKSVMVDFLDERQGRFCIGCTAIVRVTLDNGTYREDIGYGTVENERRKSAAFERAKKSAVTDALKRSLRGFGNALGNCLYDKDFLSRIDKVKFDPPDFDEGNLFRPSDEISEATRANTTEDSGPPSKRRQFTNFKPEPTTAQTAASALSNSNNVKGPESADPDQDDLLDDSLMFSDDFQDDDLIRMGENPDIPPQDRPGAASTGQAPQKKPPSTSSSDPVTFVNARGAKSLQDKIPITEENVFDPKYNAQSVKHTIDQTTSKHIPISVLKEKGIESSRDTVYQNFAPKGKQLDIKADTNTAPTEVNNNSSGGNSRFAPPTAVVHPNSVSFITQQQQTRAAPIRREVGRPKVNPLNLRKTNP